MQTKKRAKSVKFGNKINEVKMEEEEESIESANVVNDGQSIIAVSAVGQVGDLKETIKEQTMTKEDSIAEKTQEDVEKTSANETQVILASARVNEDSLKEEMKIDEQIQIKEPEVNTIMGQKSTVNDDNGYVVQTGVNRSMIRYFIVIAVVSFLIGLISMAGISLILSKKSFELPLGLNKTAKISPSPTSIVKIEPTKVPVVNLAEYNIEVLNGSEVAGAASRLKTALTTAGFEVGSVGNADNSDYADTIISAKKKVNPAFLVKLKENLKKNYVVKSDIKTIVPDVSESDVIITIGSKVTINSSK